jgi:transcriptional regulator with XRE-family HTH domain
MSGARSGARSGALSGAGDLGRRVAERRAHLGLTREQLATRARIDPRYLQYIEERPATVAASAATRLATALGTTVGELLGCEPHAAPPPPEGRLEVLDQAECLRLLRHGSLGRIAFHDADGLVVLPVNYAVVRDAVIVRTSGTSGLAGADPGPVAFETDEISGSGRAHTAWSVLVRGRLERVTGTALAHLVRLPLLDPWAPGDRPVYLRIEPDHVSGRRFVIT